jgi:hypothetical protein
MYFEKIPKTLYSLDNAATVQVITNILQRVVLTQELQDNFGVYDEYDVTDSDTPETLAYQDILDARSLKDSRFYLTSLQNQFFPMFKLPSMNGKFKIPGVEEIKRLLYENDVGYQRRDGKLYVRRFYKLPMLLFPTEVCCALIAQDKDTFK